MMQLLIVAIHHLPTHPGFTLQGQLHSLWINRYVLQINPLQLMCLKNLILSLLPLGLMRGNNLLLIAA